MTGVIFTKFKWRTLTGYRQFMRTPEVVALISEQSQKIADAAGEGFEADVESQSGRRGTPRGSVRTVNEVGRKAEAENRALTRAVDAGRI
jgi:hypothetical protein